MFDISSDYLALDFDGVIVDSIGECLTVGYNAFVAFSGEKEKIQHLNELDDLLVIEAKALRNFIQDGADYVYIFLALKENVDIRNQAEFNRFTKKNNRLRETYFSIFYQEREALLKQHLRSWIQLNPLYPGVEEFLKNFKEIKRLFIVTTKKIKYVHEILSANHIHLFSENFFQATQTKSKRAILLDLIDRGQIEPSHFHFVDDQVETLIKIADTGVHPYLALWGYNNPEQMDLAKRDSIQTLNIQEFFRLFH